MNWSGWRTINTNIQDSSVAIGNPNRQVNKEKHYARMQDINVTMFKVVFGHYCLILFANKDLYTYSVFMI